MYLFSHSECYYSKIIYKETCLWRQFETTEMLKIDGKILAIFIPVSKREGYV